MEERTTRLREWRATATAWLDSPRMGVVWLLWLLVLVGVFVAFIPSPVWRATGVLYFISYVPEALAQTFRKRDAWARP